MRGYILVDRDVSADCAMFTFNKVKVEIRAKSKALNEWLMRVCIPYTVIKLNKIIVYTSY